MLISCFFIFNFTLNDDLKIFTYFLQLKDININYNGEKNDISLDLPGLNDSECDNIIFLRKYLPGNNHRPLTVNLLFTNSKQFESRN